MIWEFQPIFGHLQGISRSAILALSSDLCLQNVWIEPQRVAFESGKFVMNHQLWHDFADKQNSALPQVQMQKRNKNNPKIVISWYKVAASTFLGTIWHWYREFECLNWDTYLREDITNNTINTIFEAGLKQEDHALTVFRHLGWWLRIHNALLNSLKGFHRLKAKCSHRLWLSERL